MAPKFELPSLSPINISLTEGTDIPPPEESPVRPPTPGGGPLSSHPTTPNAIAGSFPRGASPNGSKKSPPPERATTPTVTTQDFSTTTTSPPQKHKLSLTSTRASKDEQRSTSSRRKFFGLKPPKSFRSFSSNHNKSTENLQTSRPGSPFTNNSSTYTTITANEAPASPPLSRKKSASWFAKRKSGMFFVGKIEDADFSSEPTENKAAPTLAPPPARKGPPAPKLPTIKSLGSDLDGGSLGDLHTAIKHI